MSACETFDAALRGAALTTERGATYGHPLDNFRRIAALHEVIRECPDPEVRHALEQIAVKIARLVQTPMHVDSVVDIAGYARTIAMIYDERERLHRQPTNLELLAEAVASSERGRLESAHPFRKIDINQDDEGGA